MITFLELATERFSVRNFSCKPIEDDKLEKILQAAKVAPTAVNFQPQELYVIKSLEAMERLTAIRPMFGAPLAVIVCYDDTLSWKNSRDGGHDSGEVDAAEDCKPSERHLAYRELSEFVKTL